MIDKIISLFYDSCPGVIRSLDAIENALKADGNHFIYRFDCDKLIACAVINKNIVVMLCVHPDYRKQGIGSALFNECEDYARSLGCDHIQLFGFDDYITPGAPIYEGNWEFFVKRGYEHTWGDGECVDMMMELRDFHHTENKLGDTINGITYRRAVISDRDRVQECLMDAADYFAPYYMDDALYDPENCEFPLIALDGDLVVGALLVGAEIEGDDLGTVGCTATRHSHRGRGVATNMVKLGTRWLKEQGLKNGYLGFTYTDIIPMYGKSGYSVSMKYFMGKKNLK